MTRKSTNLRFDPLAGSYGNELGWERNFYIYNNYFDGLSGTNTTSGLSCPAPGDGLLNATGDGIYCYSNFVSNSGVEGIIIHAPTNDSTASYYADNACYVYSNIITKDISLASGYGIRCDVSNSHVSNNVVSNSCIGLFVDGNDTTNLTTNLAFCNNTVTVAASASNNAWALYAAGAGVVNSSFSNNTCFLNMWNTTASNLNNTWTYNAGIRADSGSNNFFRSNSFNILYPTNSSGGTNYTNYYAIRVDGMYFDANFDNIISNLFVTNNISVPGGLGVYATDYDIFGAAYPNDKPTSFITNAVCQSNTFR